jgi:hypothetical protein
MLRRRHLTMPVEHSDPQQIYLEQDQQVSSESAPKWVKQIT